MSRLTLIVVIAALLVPASAQARVVGDPQSPAATPVASQDSRTPDAQDFADGRSPVVEDLGSQDRRTPDAQDFAAGRSPVVQDLRSQDRRTPDAQDFADGRSPVVQDLRSPDARPDARPVQAPEVPSAGPGGVDWPSVGVGVALFGALLLGAASIAVGVRRTRTRAI